MWTWSCGVCQMKTCRMTYEPLSVEWCCTCMWIVTLRSRLHQSNMHDCGLRSLQRLLLTSEGVCKLYNHIVKHFSCMCLQFRNLLFTYGLLVAMTMMEHLKMKLRSDSHKRWNLLKTTWEMWCLRASLLQIKRRTNSPLRSPWCFLDILQLHSCHSSHAPKIKSANSLKASIFHV